MSQQVQGVISRAKGQPVEVTTIEIPDPGPGEAVVALTAWAVRRSGLEARVVACRMIAFLALLYGVYMATLVIVGVVKRTRYHRRRMAG